MMVCAAISVEVDLVVIVCFLVVLVSRVNLTEIGHCEMYDSSFDYLHCRCWRYCVLSGK